MSHFIAAAINPRTGKSEEAEWLDGHFGGHRYGIRFADGNVHREEEIEVPHAPENVADAEVGSKPNLERE